MQFYQLKALIEGMLADPRRGIAARANLHLGQPVHFVDFRDGQMRRGKIIALSLISEGPSDRSVDKIGSKRPHTVHPSHALDLSVLLPVSFF